MDLLEQKQGPEQSLTRSQIYIPDLMNSLEKGVVGEEEFLKARASNRSKIFVKLARWSCTFVFKWWIIFIHSITVNLMEKKKNSKALEKVKGFNSRGYFHMAEPFSEEYLKAKNAAF